MSKVEINLRQVAIINRLMQKPSTLKEINAYLVKESELKGGDLTVSPRTIQRDFVDIQSVHGFSIVCDKSTNRYYIENKDEGVFNNRLMDAYNMINALKAGMGYSDCMVFEQYATGTEYLHGILHAVKNRLQLHINYHSYWSSTQQLRKIHPYFLKEFKGRWYVIGKDVEKDKMRTFALDRIQDIEITKKTFAQPKQRPNSYFKDSFGIIAADDNSRPIKTVLWFDAFQGKYVKSLPLHHSQRVLSDDENGLTIELFVHHTFDFEKEILSYGENIKVLEPSSLINTIQKRLQLVIGNYD